VFISDLMIMTILLAATKSICSNSASTDDSGKQRYSAFVAIKPFNGSALPLVTIDNKHASSVKTTNDVNWKQAIIPISRPAIE
jgi:hypothetical protein